MESSKGGQSIMHSMVQWVACIKRHRRWVFPPFFITLLLLVGCEDSPRADLRLGLNAGPITFDPRFATDAVSSRLNRLLYSRLVDFNEAAQPVPALAKWEVLNAHHYRFHLLPERARFHDGKPLRASDVVATYQSVLDKSLGSAHRASLTNILRLEALNEEILDFHLKEADPLFPGKLVIGILPAVLLKNGYPFHEKPLGSGPYRFNEWRAGNRAQITRRRDGLVVDILKIQEPTTRVLKLLRGEVDIIQSDLSPEVLDWLEIQPQLRVERTEGTRFSYLGFNLQDPVVGELKVRLAIAHAIDREGIIRHVFRGGARIANALLVPDHWAGNRHLTPIPHDIERARTLLVKAGYNEGLDIVYKTSADPFRLRIASILQAQLKQVGIRVVVQSHDWGTFYGDIKAGRFQMYSLAWVGIKTPDIFRYIFHSESIPPHGANRGRYRDPLADKLIAQTEQTNNLSQQAAIYQKIQAHLLETLPYVPLWYENNFFVAREQITGYRLGVDGNYDGLLEVTRRDQAIAK